MQQAGIVMPEICPVGDGRGGYAVFLGRFAGETAIGIENGAALALRLEQK